MKDNEDYTVSDCCSSFPILESEEMGLCPDCKEHCDYVTLCGVCDEEYEDDECEFCQSRMEDEHEKRELSKYNLNDY